MSSESDGVCVRFRIVQRKPHTRQTDVLRTKEKIYAPPLPPPSLCVHGSFNFYTPHVHPQHMGRYRHTHTHIKHVRRKRLCFHIAVQPIYIIAAEIKYRLFTCEHACVCVCVRSCVCCRWCGGDYRCLSEIQ